MDSLIQLVNGRHMDLLVTFQVSALIRVGMSPSTTVDRFFGAPNWRSVLPGPRERLVERLVNIYNKQLTDRAGYVPGAFKNALSGQERQEPNNLRARALLASSAREQVLVGRRQAGRSWPGPPLG
jgi:hypothetical protein